MCVCVCEHTCIPFHLHPSAMLSCIASLTSYAALDLQLISTNANRAFLPSGTSPAEVLIWFRSHAHLEPVTEAKQMEHEDGPGLGHMPIPGARVGGPLHPHHEGMGRIVFPKKKRGPLNRRRRNDAAQREPKMFSIVSHSPNL